MNEENIKHNLGRCQDENLVSLALKIINSAPIKLDRWVTDTAGGDLRVGIRGTGQRARSTYLWFIVQKNEIQISFCPSYWRAVLTNKNYNRPDIEDFMREEFGEHNFNSEFKYRDNKWHFIISVSQLTTYPNELIGKLIEKLSESKIEAEDDIGEFVMESGKITKSSLNQILFGPPGTGKTYSTIDAALNILEPDFYIDAQDRASLKAKFDAYVKNQQICFVTFHQSFSYEDFVEGISAVIPDGEAELKASGLSYEIKDGVFLQICDQAKRNETLDQELGVREGAKIWKISIEESNSSGETRQYCFKHGEARIGWSRIGDIRTTDLSDPQYKLGTNAQSAISNFGCDIVKGDVLLCFGSLSQICAVGVVTGEYEYTPKVPVGVREDYIHKLPVNWLATDLKFDITALNHDIGLTLKTVYQLSRIKWPSLQDALIKDGVVLGNQIKAIEKNKKPYVLIIDEINRGNISRIFGELITLIEPSKRIGADEELRVTLPYSKVPFGVPDNLYIIGTMNTSDRSLAGIDIALRRRFTFIEMPPKPELLNGVTVKGVNIGELLRVMNQRIEVLLGRAYCLGHTYFITLNDNSELDELALIFQKQIIPLLQEYFFEDWERIQWVLNDHRKDPINRFVVKSEYDLARLFGGGADNLNISSVPWVINQEAYDRAEAFLGVIDHQLGIPNNETSVERQHKNFTIKLIASGSIEVWQNGYCLSPTKPHLRDIAMDLGIETESLNGSTLNTRSLGRKIIAAITAEQA